MQRIAFGQISSIPFNSCYYRFRMKNGEVSMIPNCLASSPHQHVFLHFRQPATSKQLSLQTGLAIDTCICLLTKWANHALLFCINPKARRSRLFWLSDFGKTCQHSMRMQTGLTKLCHDVPDIDWELYGSSCFSHRSAVIKSLSHAMQPAQIKRKAIFQNPDLRMSANNVRDVIRLLRTTGTVQAVKVRRKAHLHYDLTEQGRHFRRLLLQAEVRE